ncbi:MAG: membrane protein insertion efficiency factor YidD [Paracoccaceae bacterium]
MIDDALSAISIGCIRLYQRWVSPLKGFRCAYSARHGGPGCSGFAAEQIKRVGIWRAVPKIVARLRLCSLAASTLVCASSSQSEPKDVREARKCRDAACADAGCNVVAAKCCLGG